MNDIVTALSQAKDLLFEAAGTEAYTAKTVPGHAKETRKRRSKRFQSGAVNLQKQIDSIKSIEDSQTIRIQTSTPKRKCVDISIVGTDNGAVLKVKAVRGRGNWCIDVAELVTFVITTYPMRTNGSNHIDLVKELNKLYRETRRLKALCANKEYNDN